VPTGQGFPDRVVERVCGHGHIHKGGWTEHLHR
jgi:hypothetical protein